MTIHACQVESSKIRLINDGLDLFVSFFKKVLCLNSSEAYVEPGRTSTMELFFENS